MKKLNVCALLVILFLSNVQAQKIRIKWEEYSSPSASTCKILGGNSSNDFWMYDELGVLYHYNNSQWDSTSPPLNTKYIFYLYKIVDNDNFFCVAWDKNWYSHFFEFKNNRWQKDSIVIEVPIQFIEMLDNGKIYAYGNWGKFLEYKNGKWNLIDTPIKNHIQTFAYSNNEIWLGTRSEGVYKYDGKDFINIPIDDTIPKDIYVIKVLPTGEVYAVNSNYTIYQLYKNRFVTVRKKMNDLFYRSLKKQIGFFSYPLNLNEDDSEAYFIIPQELKILSFHIFKDSSIAAASRNLNLYQGKPSQTNFFTDVASTYNISGNKLDNSFGASFVDINKDHIQDLFVHNYNGMNKLYLNNPGKQFSDVTYSKNISAFGSPFLTLFTDLNGDEYPDAVFYYRTETLDKINKAEYSFNKQFEVSKKELNINDRIYPSNFTAVDFDRDGDLDLNFTYYYNENMKAGFEITAINKWWSADFIFSEELVTLSSGWNSYPLFSDFNNDDFNDFYIGAKWRMDKLLFFENDEWIDSSIDCLPDTTRYNTMQVSSADFDNDGDLDLFIINEEKLLQVLLNDGTGKFTDVTDSLNLRFTLDQFFSHQFITSDINIGDFNNDGFLDIFISVFKPDIKRNYLMINEKGKFFTDKTDEFNIKTPPVYKSIIADVDNDGDLDIFGTKEGHNVLWLNNLDDKNYIRIIPHGIISNSQGLHSKIWVYESGHLNEKEYLAGYRQIGSIKNIANQQNELTAHFGVDAKKLYDVKVKFYGGKELILYDVKPGNQIVVRELNPFLSFFYMIPGNIFRFFANKDIQFYLLSVLFSIFILFIGIKIGINKFNWDLKLSYGLLFVNVSLFWIILILSSNASFYIKFFLSDVVVIAGILIPNVIFFYIKKNEKVMTSSEEIRNRLFKLLLEFTHGEWALRNLNSLQLLCDNVPAEDSINGKFINVFNERFKTFNEMTLPNIKEIIKLGNELKNIDKNVTESLMNCIKTVDSELKNAIVQGTDKIIINRYACSKISNSFLIIKSRLKELKQIIFSQYSCNPVEIIKSVTDILIPNLEEKNIKLERQKNYYKDYYVLIRGFELANILDNSINNSIKAIESCKQKKVEILINRFAPKIQIRIKDTGKGISKENFDRIFEKGFSEDGGTGYGLAYAREVLNFYGGRIFVKESSHDNGTIFIIELNEGTVNETAAINN